MKSSLFIIASMEKRHTNNAETIRLIGRNSRLSLIQLQIVKDKIVSLFPDLKVEVIGISSRGDALQDIPLHTVEGTDFFTQEIFAALENNEADIAVHSLKDMSGEHFFGSNQFAVVDRDDVRDVAIFNADIEEKIAAGKKIVVGTCSPRREEMAMLFLKKALPQLASKIHIEVKPIRGNVETRLRKLDNGEYDGTILATAGLNRLLSPSAGTNPDDDLKQLLSTKKLMLLPLIECVPAPCQGAIVAEANPNNKWATDIIRAINNQELYGDCYKEKKYALQFGAGCLQKFGVTTIKTKSRSYLYAAGKDAKGASFSNWEGLDVEAQETIFSSTDVMKDFFEYEWSDDLPAITTKAIFVANYKALQKSTTGLLQLKSEYFNSSTGRIKNPNPDGLQGTMTGVTTVGKQKIILASGSRTWFELAKQGYWVTASADALGFEFLLPSLGMPLLQLSKDDTTILTHSEAATRWNTKGYKAVSNYTLRPVKNKSVLQGIATADFLFWSSYSQYQHFGHLAKPTARHACAGGETAALLQQAGVQPIIFPTIKSFEQWRKSFTPSLSAG